MYVKRQALTFYSASSTTPTSTSKAQTQTGSTSTSKSKGSGGGGGSSSTQTSVSYPASTFLAGMSPALRIEYPAGSYSKRTGGTQFYAQPLVDEPYERMILSYDIWFPPNYT